MWMVWLAALGVNIGLFATAVGLLRSKSWAKGAQKVLSGIVLLCLIFVFIVAHRP
jgi:hypothetical protein